MNDGAYGSEVHKLRAVAMPEEGAVFGYCAFADIARGFGLPGQTVTSLDDLSIKTLPAHPGIGTCARP